MRKLPFTPEVEAEGISVQSVADTLHNSKKRVKRVGQRPWSCSAKFIASKWRKTRKVFVAGLCCASLISFRNNANGMNLGLSGSGGGKVLHTILRVSFALSFNVRARNDVKIDIRLQTVQRGKVLFVLLLTWIIKSFPFLFETLKIV